MMENNEVGNVTHVYNSLYLWITMVPMGVFVEANTSLNK